MSVRVTDGGAVALYCSTTGLAFGPVFETPGLAEEFLEWAAGSYGTDVRTWTASAWEDRLAEYRKEQGPE